MKKSITIWYMYVLHCRDKSGSTSFYCGITTHVLRRLTQHTKGKGAKYTRGRAVKLVHSEMCFSHRCALRHERCFKRLTRQQKLHYLQSHGAPLRLAAPHYEQ